MVKNNQNETVHYLSVEMPGRDMISKELKNKQNYNKIIVSHLPCQLK